MSLYFLLLANYVFRRSYENFARWMACCKSCSVNVTFSLPVNAILSPVAVAASFADLSFAANGDKKFQDFVGFPKKNFVRSFFRVDWNLTHRWIKSRKYGRTQIGFWWAWQWHKLKRFLSWLSIVELTAFTSKWLVPPRKLLNC